MKKVFIVTFLLAIALAVPANAFSLPIQGPVTFSQTVEGHGTRNLLVTQRQLVDGKDYGGPLPAASGWYDYAKAPASDDDPGYTYPNNPTFTAKFTAHVLTGAGDDHSDPTKSDPYRLYYRLNGGHWILIGGSNGNDDYIQSVCIGLGSDFQSQSLLEFALQYVSGRKRNEYNVFGLAHGAINGKDVNVLDETGISIVATPFCGNFVPTKGEFLEWGTFVDTFWTMHNGREGGFDPVFDPICSVRNQPYWRGQLAQLAPDLLLRAEPDNTDVRRAAGVNVPAPLPTLAASCDADSVSITPPGQMVVQAIYIDSKGKVYPGKKHGLHLGQIAGFKKFGNGMKLSSITIQLTDGSTYTCDSDGNISK